MEQIRFKYLLFYFLQTFPKNILEFKRPHPNSTFNVPNSLGLTYFTRQCVGLSPLPEHKFRHNFWDSLNLVCNCGSAMNHYLLNCSNFKNERQSLLQNVIIVNPNLLSINEDALTHLLLYGDNPYRITRHVLTIL